MSDPNYAEDNPPDANEAAESGAPNPLRLLAGKAEDLGNAGLGHLQQLYAELKSLFEPGGLPHQGDFVQGGKSEMQAADEASGGAQQAVNAGISQANQRPGID